MYVSLYVCCLIRKGISFSLYEARVGQYLGTLTMEDMLEVFNMSRKVQHFFHYNAMSSMIGFNELTTR